jgi:4-diphosphocytidyl-2-C-methyl-D-erythritol kinase
MKKFRVKCPAKINLFLKITGLRSDGYHELESLFTFLNLYDNLEVTQKCSFKLEIQGKFSHLVNEKKNLFTEILDFFSQEFGISKDLHIKITKNIPVGAGLGGGSSNAAFFMKILNKIFTLNLTVTELQKISLKFGSDIGFFLQNRAAIVKGRGEIIENFPQFKAITALLINPGITVSTREVFLQFNQNLVTKRGQNFSSKIPTPILIRKNIFDLIKNLPNDMEETAKLIAPIITEILAELKNCGAEIAKISGSGASCFGIFKDKKNLITTAKYFQKKFPAFFTKEVKILNSWQLYHFPS